MFVVYSMCPTDLYKCPSLLTKGVIMLKLHCNCFVTVHCSHLHICSCVHINCTKEVCGPETLSTDNKYRIRFVISQSNKLTLLNLLISLSDTESVCFLLFESDSFTCVGSNTHNGIKSNRLLHISS